MCQWLPNLNGDKDITSTFFPLSIHVILFATSISALKCDPPSDPTNGYHKPLGEVQYSQNVTFHCDTGYTLTGSRSATCKADGTWSNFNTTCTGMNYFRSDSHLEMYLFWVDLTSFCMRMRIAAKYWRWPCRSIFQPECLHQKPYVWSEWTSNVFIQNWYHTSHLLISGMAEIIN